MCFFRCSRCCGGWIWLRSSGRRWRRRRPGRVPGRSRRRGAGRRTRSGAGCGGSARGPGRCGRSSSGCWWKWGSIRSRRRRRRPGSPMRSRRWPGHRRRRSHAGRVSARCRRGGWPARPAAAGCWPRAGPRSRSTRVPSDVGGGLPESVRGFCHATTVRKAALSRKDDDQVRRLERAREIGLFRYMLIREAADASLTGRQRGALVRAIAAVPHTDPDGRAVRITRWTLDRWILKYREGGFDALVPSPRQSQPRTPREIFELASALKKENPSRSAAQVRRILHAQLGWAPDETTLQRMFVRTGLTALRAPAEPAVFGRFEAGRPNEIWTGDALHGPRIGGRKSYLFAFLDDHSRAITGHRWGFAEDTVRLAAALRPALAARGVPGYVYVDNGSAFVDSWLLRACAKLGIKLVHSAPGRPQGRGKIERFFRTVNSEFVVEIAAGDGEPGRQVGDLAEMNRLFTAWVETVYHRRVHSETGMAPLPRWLEGGPYPVPAPADLAEAFRWSEHRTVSKTALVSLHGNRYQVDPGLAGRKVELAFDPFDLTFLRVRLDGADAGTALPFQITRHSHPKARPEVPAEPPKPATGIDYLGLIDSAHTAELAGKVNYSALTSSQDDRHSDDPGTGDQEQP